MKKITLLALLGKLVITMAHGQGVSHVPTAHNQTVPPTSTASSLATTVSIQPNLAKGVVDVAVPLYSIPTATTPVNITLQYATQGVRVRQLPSWVGLGWGLNIGGVIQRTVKDYPDDNVSSRFVGYRSLADPSVQSRFPNIAPGLEESRWDRIGLDWTVDTPVRYYMQAYTMHRADAEPDDFSLTVLGKTYSFMFNRQGEIVADPKLKFEYKLESPQRIKEWTVTLEDGTICTFAAGERTSSGRYTNAVYNSDLPVTGPVWSVYTAWYLTEIKQPTGLVIASI